MIIQFNKKDYILMMLLPKLRHKKKYNNNKQRGKNDKQRKASTKTS